MKVDHRGGTVHYHESENRWYPYVGENSVSNRGFGSLKDGRAALDRLIDAEDKLKKKFDKCNAWLVSYSGRPEFVQVTSRADDGEVWIKRDDKRRKVRAADLRADTADNLARVKLMTELRESETKLEKERYALAEKLTDFKLPD